MYIFCFGGKFIKYKLSEERKWLLSCYVIHGLEDW